MKRDLQLHKKRIEEKKGTILNSELGGLSGPIINIESASNSTRNVDSKSHQGHGAISTTKSVRSHAGKLKVKDDDEVSRSPS